MDSDGSAPRAPEPVERFVRDLNHTAKAMRLYPASSQIPQDGASAAAESLEAIRKTDEHVVLKVTKEGLVYKSARVFPGQGAFSAFAREFFRRRIFELTFQLGVDADELIEFLKVLEEPQEELVEEGGFQARLWEAGVENISVKEASTKIVDAFAPSSEEENGEEWPPSAATIDDFLAAEGGSAEGRRVLLRFVQSPDALGSYFREVAVSTDTIPTPSWLTNRTRALANLAWDLPGDERASVCRSVAEGLLQLGEDTLGNLLTKRLLLESRHNDALADVVRQMSLDEICAVLASNAEESQASKEGLARALRSLTQIRHSATDSATEAMGNALIEEGVSESFVAEVLGEVAPTHIKISEFPGDEDSETESILQLIDLVPAAGNEEHAPELEVLVGEAKRGITDGDVLRTLVAVALSEYRNEQFESALSLVQNSISLLAARGEFEVAADSVEALWTSAQEDEKRSAEHRDRFIAVLDELLEDEQLKAIVSAICTYPKDTPEHESCCRLLRILAQYSLRPLLEITATVSDEETSTRLVDLISDVAEPYVDELGRSLEDGRPAFVRNSVAIMGRLRDPRCLSHLSRTLHHADVGVRRETIRSASGIRHERATEMLIVGLEDVDPINARLSAEALGVAGGSKAEAALIKVVLDLDDVKHDTALKVATVEALGRIGSEECIVTLRRVARPRGVVRRIRSREICSAAKTALKAVETRSVVGARRE